jgi:hypothetical protein
MSTWDHPYPKHLSSSSTLTQHAVQSLHSGTATLGWTPTTNRVCSEEVFGEGSRVNIWDWSSFIAREVRGIKAAPGPLAEPWGMQLCPQERGEKHNAQWIPEESTQLRGQCLDGRKVRQKWGPPRPYSPLFSLRDA